MKDVVEYFEQRKKNAEYMLQLHAQAVEDAKKQGIYTETLQGIMSSVGHVQAEELRVCTEALREIKPRFIIENRFSIC